MILLVLYTILCAFFLAVFENFFPNLFVPFLEEFFGRILPLYVYSFRARFEPFSAGFIVGLTFGICENIIKTINYGSYSLSYVLPIVFVHIPNAIILSYAVVKYRTISSLSVLIAAYSACLLWHWLYNAFFYFV